LSYRFYYYYFSILFFLRRSYAVDEIAYNGRAMGVACGNTRLAYAHDALALLHAEKLPLQR